LLVYSTQKTYLAYVEIFRSLLIKNTGFSTMVFIWETFIEISKHRVRQMVKWLVTFISVYLVQNESKTRSHFPGRRSKAY